MQIYTRENLPFTNLLKTQLKVNAIMVHSIDRFLSEHIKTRLLIKD